MRKDNRYAIKYTFDAESRKEGYTKDDLESGMEGLCDSIIVVSIVKPPDGSYSQLLMTMDGDTGKDLTEKDLFKMALMVFMKLSDDGKLKGYQKQTVDMVTELVREHFRGKH